MQVLIGLGVWLGGCLCRLRVLLFCVLLLVAILVAVVFFVLCLLFGFGGYICLGHWHSAGRLVFDCMCGFGGFVCFTAL